MKFKNLLLSIGTVTLAVGAALPARANFSFSDFNFYRHNDPATEFHTTEYLNDDGSDAGLGVQAFQQFVNQEASAIDLDELNARKLDATKLDIVENIDDLKVYFIHEGAGYRNQLKLTTTGTTTAEGLIFVNGSMGSGSEQLQKGDYVSFGEVKAGSTLDFSLLANAYQNDSFYTYYAGAERNLDNIQHVMAYEYKGYLILAWEDLYEGGDKDYNDIVFAIDVGDNLPHFPDEPTASSPPKAIDDSVETPHNTEIFVDVLANDSHPDGETFSLTEIDNFLTDGTVAIEGDKVVYTPENGSSQTDTFEYTITDANGATDSATVTVVVGEAPEVTIYAD